MNKKITIIVIILLSTSTIILGGSYYLKLEKTKELEDTLLSLAEMYHLKYSILGRNSQLAFGGEKVLLDNTIIENMEMVNEGT